MKQKKGFTLFELLVSISIIGILIAISSVSFSAAQKKARDARRMEDMKTVQKAAETFYSLQSYVYPANAATAWVATLAGGDTILAVYPSDPKPSPYIQYSYTIDTPAVGGYCACADVENDSSENSDSSCDFSAATKGYFCVKNQQ